MSFGSLVLLHLQVFLGVVISLYGLVILRNVIRMFVLPGIRSNGFHNNSLSASSRFEMPGRTRPIADFRILLQQSHASQNVN